MKSFRTFLIEAEVLRKDKILLFLSKNKDKDPRIAKLLNLFKNGKLSERQIKAISDSIERGTFKKIEKVKQRSGEDRRNKSDLFGSKDRRRVGNDLRQKDRRGSGSERREESGKNDRRRSGSERREKEEWDYYGRREYPRDEDRRRYRPTAKEHTTGTYYDGDFEDIPWEETTPVWPRSDGPERRKEPIEDEEDWRDRRRWDSAEGGDDDRGGRRERIDYDDDIYLPKDRRDEDGIDDRRSRDRRRGEIHDKRNRDRRTNSSSRRKGNERRIASNQNSKPKEKTQDSKPKETQNSKPKETQSSKFKSKETQYVNYLKKQGYSDNYIRDILNKRNR